MTEHSPRGLRSLAVDPTPFRHRDFRLLYAGQSVTFLGSMITYVAIPYQVWELTHSSALVGLLGLVEFAAMISMAFVGGALADSMDRRRMVRLTELGMLLASLALCTNALRDHPSTGVLYAVAGVATMLDALQRPSLDALLPRLVPKEELLAASALSMLRGNVGMLAGPALGGLLIASIGLPGTYLFDVGSFAFSLVALTLMRAVPPPPDADRPSARGVLEGIRYARSRPELMGTYLVDINAMFFGMPNALFPQLAAGLGGPAVLGLLYSAPAVGSILVSLTSGWTRRIRRHGVAILWSASVWGVAIALVGVTRRLDLTLVFLALAGAGDAVSGLFRMTVWNTTIPDHLRGRLAGIEMISYSTGPTLGNVEAGLLASAAGPRFSVAFGGVACVVGTLALALALPAFRRYDASAVSSSGSAPHEPQDQPAPA